MIEKTIADIEARLQDSAAVDDRTRVELLGLLATLRSEMAELSRTHPPQARQIAGATRVSTEAATVETKNPEVIKSAVDDLAASVAGFETSHPRLVEAVNRICVTLSNIGI